MGSSEEKALMVIRADSGISETIARLFAARQNDVLAADINQDSVERKVGEIKREDLSATGIATDASSEI